MFNQETELKDLGFTLHARPPFRLDLTVWALRRRAANRVDRWDGQFYRRVLPVGPDREPVLATVSQMSDDELRVTLSGRAVSPLAPSEVGAALVRMLGLETDLPGFYRMAERDPRLGPLAEKFSGLKPPRFPTVFETLVNAIACQQITLTLGILLLGRLAEAYGRTPPALRQTTGEAVSGSDRAFPLPADLAAAPPEALRTLGFSHQKARYLIDLAAEVAANRLDLEALAERENTQAIAELCRLRGVGRWSAEYVLLRGLGRLDVFPGDDVGARNNLRRWLGLAEKLDYEGVQRAVAPWQPYGGLIYLHLLLDSLEDLAA